MMGYEQDTAASNAMMAYARPQGEWLTIAALLLPWAALSTLLPAAHLVVALSLLVALGALLAAAVTWSRARAHTMAIDPEAWALAAALTLGYSMLMLLGKEKSGFEALCGDCGKAQDARARFCHACGAYA